MGPPPLRPGIVTRPVMCPRGLGSFPHQLSPTPGWPVYGGVLRGPHRMSQPGCHLYEGGLGTRGPSPLTHTNFIRKYWGQYPAAVVHARYNRRCLQSSKPFASVFGGILLLWGKGLIKYAFTISRHRPFCIAIHLPCQISCKGRPRWARTRRGGVIWREWRLAQRTPSRWRRVGGRASCRPVSVFGRAPAYGGQVGAYATLSPRGPCRASA